MRKFCVFLAGAFFAVAAAHAHDDLDGIIEVVNNSIITKLQVEEGIAGPVKTLRAVYGPNSSNFWFKVRQYQQEELDALERKHLILDDFARGAYSTNWVDDEVNKMLKEDLKKNYEGSEIKLTQTLQAEGRTKEQYRKEMRERVIVDELAHYHSVGKIIISPAAIEKYYYDHLDEFKVEDQVKLRTICIAPAAGDPPGTAKALAAEIMRKIDGGIPFADMARECSADQYRSAGGDWGRWVERSEMLAPLAEAAFSLKPGQRGQVEVTDERTKATDCYLLLVEDARPAHVRPLSEVEDAIDGVLHVQRGSVLLEQWIKRLRAKSQTQILP